MGESPQSPPFFDIGQRGLGMPRRPPKSRVKTTAEPLRERDLLTCSSFCLGNWRGCSSFPARSLKGSAQQRKRGKQNEHQGSFRQAPQVVNE